MSTFELAIYWSIKLNAKPEYLCVCDDQTFVFATNSKFICLDNLTGKPVWRTSLKPGVRGIAANRNHVYVGTQSHVEAYNRIDGSLTWSVFLPPQSMSPSATDKEVDRTEYWKRVSLIGPLSVSEIYLLAGGWRGYSPIYSLHPDTGEYKWAADLSEPWVGVQSTLIRASGREWICTLANNQLLILSPNSGEIIEQIALPDGEKLWSKDLRDSEGSASSGGLSDHWLLQGKESIYRFIPGNPSTFETFAVGEPISAMQPLACSGRAFFTNSANILKSYHLSSGEVESFGRIIHNSNYLLPVSGTNDGLFYVGSSFGFLSVFSSNGQQLFRKKIAKGICTEITRLPDHSVILGLASGQVIRCKLNLVGDS